MNMLGRLPRGGTDLPNWRNNVKIYEFEVYGGSGVTIQLPIIGAYCSRISPIGEAEHTVWCLMMESL